MPTKQGWDEALPSPAWTFALLTGGDPGCRLTGWVTRAQAGRFGEPTAADIWAQHGDALTALAEENGFSPHYQTKRRPSGDGFERWRDAFLAKHTY
jgi:hypothetical protein